MALQYAKLSRRFSVLPLQRISLHVHYFRHDDFGVCLPQLYEKHSALFHGPSVLDPKEYWYLPLAHHLCLKFELISLCGKLNRSSQVKRLIHVLKESSKLSTWSKTWWKRKPHSKHISFVRRTVPANRLMWPATGATLMWPATVRLIRDLIATLFRVQTQGYTAFYVTIIYIIIYNNNINYNIIIVLIILL